MSHHRADSGYHHATIMTAHIRNTRIRSQAVQCSMAGIMTMAHSDIHMAHSQIHLDQVCPRKSCDCRQSKRADRGDTLGRCYKHRAQRPPRLRRLVSERRKKSALVRQLPLQTVIAKPHLFGFCHHGRKTRNRREGVIGYSDVTTILAGQPGNLCVSEVAQPQASLPSF
jgi:hypothetical protein